MLSQKLPTKGVSLWAESSLLNLILMFLKLGIQQALIALASFVASHVLGTELHASTKSSRRTRSRFAS